jgi:hypothetical protein
MELSETKTLEVTPNIVPTSEKFTSEQKAIGRDDESRKRAGSTRSARCKQTTEAGAHTHTPPSAPTKNPKMTTARQPSVRPEVPRRRKT